MGVQVNAITKSGTNTLSGSFSGVLPRRLARRQRFRRRTACCRTPISSSAGRSADRSAGTACTSSSTTSTSAQPQTISYSSAYPSFNIDQIDTITEKKGGVRLDLQFSPKNRLSVRGNGSERWEPYDARYTGGASKHPSSAIQSTRHSNDLGVTLTQVLGANTFNEVQAGYVGFYWILDSKIPWAESSLWSSDRDADPPDAQLHHRAGARLHARVRGCRELHDQGQPDVLAQQVGPP